MPLDAQQRAAAVGRVIPFVTQGILAAILLLLLARSELSLERIGLGLAGWPSAVLTGVLAGGASLGFLFLLHLVLVLSTSRDRLSG